MKWFKFYGQDYLTDTKLIGIDPLMKTVWITLLCLADEYGEIKYLKEWDLIKMAGTDDNTYENSDLNRTEGCLKFFEERGMIALQTVTNSNETRNAPVTYHVTLVNYLKRQVENMSNAERQKRFREKVKLASKKTKTTRNDSNAGQRNDSNARLDKIRLDKNRLDNNITTAVAVADDLNSLIGMFKEVNPSYEKLYSNKTQRKALADMLSTHGRDKVEWSINFAKRVYGKQYAPQITTPVQLEQKLGSLIAYAKSKEDEKPKIAVMPL